MHNSFLEQINIKGHLTIHKVANGEEELIYDEDNVITSGFGYSLSHLFGLAGGTNITDYQIDRSARYTIFIDEDSCNNLTRVSDEVNLNEIALFVKNPTGDTVNEISSMAAYRYFSNIRKTNQFGLVFRWTITFG